MKHLLWRLRQRRRYREALVRIAGTPTMSSDEEARAMAREAMRALAAGPKEGE